MSIVANKSYAHCSKSAKYTITNHKTGDKNDKTISILSVTILTLVAFITPSTALALGATQVSGIAYWPTSSQCTDPEGAGSNYAVVMTGALTGCHYTFVETAVCSSGGVYNETGTEIFVGQYNGGSGSFETTYRFTASYTDCSNLVGELVGRCQHPIIAGSGKGIFEGVTGRLDMQDDIAAGNFLYRGHLQWYKISSGLNGQFIPGNGREGRVPPL